MRKLLSVKSLFFVMQRKDSTVCEKNFDTAEKERSKDAPSEIFLSRIKSEMIIDVI